MPLRIAYVATLALATLAGCSSTPWSSGRPGATDESQMRCNAEPAQFFIGRTNTAKNLEQARQRSGALIARVLHPGQATTREFNAQRINLEVDATGRILAVRCG